MKNPKIEHMHKFKDVDKKLQEHEGLQNLLGMMEIHYLGAHDDVGNGLDLQVKEISSNPGQTVIGVYPVRTKPNIIWYGDGMKETLEKNILKTTFGYCEEFSGPGIRLNLTDSKVKRLKNGLKGFTDEVIIYLFLQPEK